MAECEQLDQATLDANPSIPTISRVYYVLYILNKLMQFISLH